MRSKPKRSLRRSHKRRMKRRARWVYPDDPKAEKLGDHLKLCSRETCGNRRRMLGRPVHERRSDIDMREGISEYGPSVFRKARLGLRRHRLPKIIAGS